MYLLQIIGLLIETRAMYAVGCIAVLVALVGGAVGLLLGLAL